MSLDADARALLEFVAKCQQQGTPIPRLRHDIALAEMMRVSRDSIVQSLITLTQLNLLDAVEQLDQHGPDKYVWPIISLLGMQELGLPGKLPDPKLQPAPWRPKIAEPRSGYVVSTQPESPSLRRIGEYLKRHPDGCTVKAVAQGTNRSESTTATRMYTLIDIGAVYEKREYGPALFFLTEAGIAWVNSEPAEPPAQSSSPTPPQTPQAPPSEPFVMSEASSRILEHLQTNGETKLANLAHALRLSTQTIMKYLSDMLAHGLITRQALPTIAGKPPYGYSIAPKGVEELQRYREQTRS